VLVFALSRVEDNSSSSMAMIFGSRQFSLTKPQVGPRGIEPRTFGLKALQDDSDDKDESPENGR
jgi:hypothetical protein